MTECVPWLPMPDWNWTLPSGLMMNRPSNPIEPPENALIATPAPRTFDADALAAARLLLFPVEELGALVERFLDERAGHVRLLVARRRAGPNFALPAGALILRISHLIDAELIARPW